MTIKVLSFSLTRSKERALRDTQARAGLYGARSLIATTSSVASLWRRRGRRGGKGKIRVLH